MAGFYDIRGGTQ